MPTPEELARQNIDALLKQCGWTIQKRSEINLSAARGVGCCSSEIQPSETRHRRWLSPNVRRLFV
jgi:hypothetical protein